MVVAPPRPSTIPLKLEAKVSRNGKRAPPGASGGKSRCIPHDAHNACTSRDSKCSSTNSRDDCITRRARSSGHVHPRARLPSNRARAACTEGSVVPRRGKRCGATSPNQSASPVHASASAGDMAPTMSSVAAMSVDTPTKRPSGKTDENGLSLGANARPCRARSSPYSAKNGEPAKRLRFVANRSWRNPGTVSSSVRTAPPGAALRSSTMTLRPAEASTTAVASPLMPEPTTTQSYVEPMTPLLPIEEIIRTRALSTEPLRVEPVDRSAGDDGKDSTAHRGSERRPYDQLCPTGRAGRLRSCLDS